MPNDDLASTTQKESMKFLSYCNLEFPYYFFITVCVPATLQVPSERRQQFIHMVFPANRRPGKFSLN